jgi:DNA-binding IclR family transcriptional regulator
MKTKPTRPKPRTAEGLSRSVSRVLVTLDAMLAKGRPVSISEILDDLGLSRTTAYEMMRTLKRYHYVEQLAGTGKYRLGRRLYELGTAYRDQVDLLKEGTEIASQLCGRTHETVQISVLDTDSMLVVIKNQGTQPIAFVTQVGSRIPINWGASGRLLVSDFSDEELRQRLPAMVRPSPTGKAPTDVDVLIREIREARKRGYAFQLSQAAHHSGAVAAPIIDGSGRCIATISVVAPEHRFRKSHLAMITKAVREAATQLSRRLGG